MKKDTLLSTAKALAVLILLNVLGNLFYDRLDLTEDKRYTLSEPGVNSVLDFEKPVIIDVLLDGNLPSEFVKLKIETQQLLAEFASKNKNIKFNFLDPLANVEDTDAVFAQLQRIGLKPANVTVEENGKVSQEIVFPWAMVNYGEKTVKVSLLKNTLGASQEERINNSVQHLEYGFADAFSKLKLVDKKSVAVIKGNGELDDIYLADYLSSIREYYNIGAITMDSVASSPQKVLDQLKNYDLALIAKPTERFTDDEKYVLDQYIMNGGKSIWLIDKVAMELDSLFNETGSNLAIQRDLNLDDFFFKYGVRINPVLVNDMYFTQIVLASGEGNDSQFNPLPWYFNPMVFSKNDHPINNNLEALRMQFANSIDTLPNTYDKTVLYSSSPLSKTVGIPTKISLDIINIPPKKESYTNGNKPLAVLIEGRFVSAFKNRIKPVQLKGVKEESSIENKMLVVADGDVIKNQIKNGQPLELGYDKWTNNFFGNKEFLMNSINYLLDDTGLINIRNKRVAIPLLDTKKIENQKTKWQLVNIGLPLVLTVLFGLAFNYIRKKKYSK
ncbi:gliding motility-associated ABC transporter substrate-binding protein GldG [Costertonia aggregata]|uniref:Gliding motility-associated ABC transporter substrate-binding protein GldG n=1 Tax=Costertonia aggregata TaxID=343403 RepID=A0A7H9ATE7_9FLAO|nr:gliding motility-associated ABC transporter substrate-binding protein GldG [Costertonia aggregata]QLG46720.1 gliding motility-associated ABC transporter substrate-binding protein GldG [Costertonia aggregata]